MTDTNASHLERRDMTRNMNRFYRITIARDLFGTIVLMREWGRIGRSVRLRTDEKASLAEALRDAEWLARQKHRRGYRPVAG